MPTDQEIIKMQSRFNKIFIPICFVISSIFLVGGIIFLIYTANFVYNAKSAIGIVTDLKYVKGHNSSAMISPKIKYEVEGKIYEKYSSLSSSSGFNAEIGENINILYNPKNPSEFMINKWDIWVLPILFTCLGVFGNFMGFAFYKLNKKAA